MELTKPKVFEKADAGIFLATCADIVDMPNVTSVWNGQTKTVNKVRFLWILGTLDGKPLFDKEGKPLTIAEFFNAVQADNSNMSKRLAQIFPAGVPLLNTTEDISNLMIGRSAQLFLVKAPNKKNPLDPYTNVSGAAPLSPGQVPPPIPSTFVREINKPKMVAGQQTYATPAAAAAATAASSPTAMAAAQPDQAAQFAAWQAEQARLAQGQPQTPAQQTGNAPAATPPAPMPQPTAPPAPVPGVPPSNVSF